MWLLSEIARFEKGATIVAIQRFVSRGRTGVQDWSASDKTFSAQNRLKTKSIDSILHQQHNNTGLVRAGIRLVLKR